MNGELKRFCDNVRVLRRNRGLSQIELGEKLGISKGAVSTLETGHGTSFGLMFKLSDFFGVSVSDMFGKEFENEECKNIDGRVKRCEYCGDIFQFKNNLAQMCPSCKKEYHRLYCYTMNNLDKRCSGLNYDNPPEKLEAIKEKYRNGVTDDIMKEFESKWAKTENPFCP